MKPSLLRTILDWLLITSLILSTVLFVKYFFSSKELRTVRTQYELAVVAQRNVQVVQAIANDMVEYSKRDPGVLPILKTLGYEPAKTAPAANGAKPPGK